MSFQEEAFKILMAEIHKLRAENAKLKEALEYYNKRANHSCNIEYGNNVGIENCALCKGLLALAKAEEVLK